MKTLMSFVFLMPMIFAAVPSRAASDSARPVRDVDGSRGRDEYHPQPYPYPRYCHEGTHRSYDEFVGGYVCVPDKDFGPRPMPWHGERMKKLGEVLGGDDMAAKGEALAGFFDAARSLGSGADKDGVAASEMSDASASYLKPQTGDLKLIHTDPSMPVPSIGTKPGPRILRVNCTDDKGCKSPPMQRGKEVIEDLVDLYNKAQNYKRENEENQKKYEEGTKKWNDTHEDYLKKRKDDKNIS